MTNERKKEIENLTVDILKEYGLYRVNGAAPIFVKDELQKRFTFTFYEVNMENNLQYQQQGIHFLTVTIIIIKTHL